MRTLHAWHDGAIERARWLSQSAHLTRCATAKPRQATAAAAAAAAIRCDVNVLRANDSTSPSADGQPTIWHAAEVIII